MSTFLNQTIKVFSEKFKPANNITQATDFLDTEEIYKAIKKLAPEADLTVQQLFEALQTSGYKFSAEPGKLNFNLKWMLIRQN